VGLRAVVLFAVDFAAAAVVLRAVAFFAAAFFAGALTDVFALVLGLVAGFFAVGFSEAGAVVAFGVAPAALTFRVYQISAQVGRGFASEATVEITP